MALVKLDREAAQRGELPPVCVRCGAPATAQRRRVFTGRTPFTITVGRGVVWARLPSCAKHRVYLLLARVAQIVLFGLLLALVWLLSRRAPLAGDAGWQPYRGALVLALLAVLAVWMAVRCVAFYADVRLVSATWSTLVLTGVSEAFARACRDEPLEVTAAHPQTAEEDDEPVLTAELVEPRSEPRREARPRGSVTSGWGLPLIGLLLAGILSVAVCAGGAVLYWQMTAVNTPVTLRNARVTSALGIATHVQVDYRCRTPLAPGRQVLLVVEQDGRRLAQRSFSSLGGEGTLDIDVLGSMRTGGSRARVFLEEAAPGPSGRQRISNAVAVQFPR